MRREIQVFWLLVGAAAALVQANGVAPRAFAAFAAGELLFGANLMLLVLVVSRLFAAAAAGRAMPPSRWRTLLLGCGLLAKVFLLATGAYVALVTFSLPASYFIGGLLAAFAALAVPALLRRQGSQRGDAAATV